MHCLFPENSKKNAQCALICAMCTQKNTKYNDFLALLYYCCCFMSNKINLQTIADAKRSKGEKSTCIRTINPNGKHEKLYKNPMDQRRKRYICIHDWKRSEMKKNKKLFYSGVNIGGQRVLKKKELYTNTPFQSRTKHLKLLVNV